MRCQALASLLNMKTEIAPRVFKMANVHFAQNSKTFLAYCIQLITPFHSTSVTSVIK